MKRIFYALVFLFSAYGTMGQCVPDPSFTSPGIFPPAGSTINGDATINLPDAEVGVAYDQIIQVRIPSDTTILFAGTTVTASVDSFRIDFISDLPSGLNYDCNNATCAWPGGSNGCVRIFGTPNGPVQEHDLGVGIRGFLQVFTVPIDSLQMEDRFKIQVNAPASLSENQSVTLKLFPNPATQFLNIELGNLEQQAVDWTLIDLSGRVISQGSFDHVPGFTHRVQLNAAANGLYLMQFSTNRGMLTRRVTIHE